MRVVFAGTPDFAVPSLEALLDSPIVEPVAAYAQPDRPAGRGRKIRFGPVKARAVEAGVPVFQPDSLDDPRAVFQLQMLKPDLLVVVAYGALLKRAHLDIPVLGCVNLHASLLPRWRGAAPIQRAIEAGDSETGVSLMRIDEGLDCGPVLARRKIALPRDATGGWLHDRLSGMAGELLSDSLETLRSGQLAGEPQDSSQATYAKKLNRSESAVDWTHSATQIERRIRAFDPWPGSTLRAEGATLKILRAAAVAHVEPACPGRVLSAGPDGLLVKAGRDAVRIERVQRPGGRAVDVREYLNGHPVPPGTVLESSGH